MKETMEIYKHKALIKPNYIQKIFRKEPSENAVIEINNLFADKQINIDEIQPEQIIGISDKYKINLKKDFKDERLDLFNKYLQYCLEDKKLDNKEIRLLIHMRRILFLNDTDTKNLIKIETEKIFEKKVKEKLKDAITDKTVKNNLERIKKELFIDEKTAEEIYKKNAGEILGKFIDGTISDERLSPEEESEINKIAENLGINFKLDEKSKAVLDRYKLYWQIENGELPVIDSEINIHKSEKLYFKAHVNWIEQRRVTKRINYSGPTARIKIVNGIYYRMGSISVHPVTEDVWKIIDSGQIYLTNKRLIFMGATGNKTIRLNRILDITLYENGVEIQKETGKSPFLEFSENPDIFSMILVRLLNEI